jgi:ribosomal protein L11 methylase PrmA
MKTFLLILLSFATLARADDVLKEIKDIETENHVKFVGEAPINGSNRTQWVFAAPDSVNGIRIRIHVISNPSRLEYLAAELSAYGEAQAAYQQLKEPKRSRPPTPAEQAVGVRLEPGDAFGTNPATGAYQIYNVDTKKWRPIQ